MTEHKPVMLEQIMDYLQIKPGNKAIDCTLGGGGYTLKLSQKVGTKGNVIAIDLDKLALDHAKALIKEHGLGNIILVHDNFANLKEIIDKHLKTKVNAIVLDLGMSSAQLDDPERGFSFQTDADIDMSFGNPRVNTQTIVNKYSARELEEVIKKYGEERYARSIAKAIVQSRKKQRIITTKQLVDIIAKAVPGKYKQGKIHFATRTFQALRIETNQELENLKAVLPQALEALKTGGRIAVLSFHSLEDRIVKNFFKQESKDCICPPELPTCQCYHKAKLKILTKKIIKPKQIEIKSNPRARSAKLRVAEKIKYGTN
ncbi:MAG: 16S rRNA (cytosine(1402)-N(4))-methyltransferase RsmH [bacterium]